MMISITRLDKRRKMREKEQYRLSNQQVDTPFILYPNMIFTRSSTELNRFFLSFFLRSYVSRVQDVYKKKIEDRMKEKNRVRLKRTNDEEDREKNWLYICVGNQMTLSQKNKERAIFECFERDSSKIND